MDNYKTRVRNSFDSKAKYYDKFAKIQKLVAQRMIERLEIINITPKRILDLGCGTGILARLLKEKYKSCNVVSVDLSLRMLKICKEKKIQSSLLCCDIEDLPLRKNSFDLIISSFTFHWCENIVKVLKDVEKCLDEKGIFFFSTLGPDSLIELKESFLAIDSMPHVNEFIDMHHYGDILSDLNFLDPVMDIENITLKFNNFFAAMNSIRKIGANTLAKQSSKSLNKSQVKDLILNYPQTPDSKYPLSYEVIYGTAWKRKLMSHIDSKVVIPIKPKK
tara:strand:- start:143 stop:970 length:828 start_codon:yes stop_codon:yes gene_type:complete